MENKKNTILLTVIAVATLLVAVVGATFAFFTAQGGASKETPVTVQTNTTDSATFAITGDLTITANQQNFAQGMANLHGDATATASFTANSAADSKICYTVSLTVTNNNFVKCADDTTCNGNAAVTDKSAKELTFTAQKDQGKTGTFTKLLDEVDITKGTATVQVPTTAGGTNYIHQIDATKGTTVVDDWKFNVTFVNLNHDQQYNSVNKSFVGKVVMAKADCPAA